MSQINNFDNAVHSAIVAFRGRVLCEDYSDQGFTLVANDARTIGRVRAWLVGYGISGKTEGKKMYLKFPKKI